jgi:hypothetical protein
VLQAGGAIGMRVLASKVSFWPDKQQWLIILLVIATLFFAALSGAVVAMGSKILLLPFAALIGMFLFVMVPVQFSLWALLVVCFLVVGPVMYFLKFELARWFPPIFAISLFVPLLFNVLWKKDRQFSGTPSFIYSFIVFFLVLAFSTMLTDPTFGELVTNWRNYIAFWSVAFLVMSGVIRERQLSSMWRFMLLAAVVQLPVVMYQRFFVATLSAWDSSWDAIVGTFPGNEEGGGTSGAMALFLLSALVVAIALWRQKQLKTPLMLVVAGAVIGSIAMAEVKGVVMMIPLALGLLYFKDLVRKPGSTLLMIILGLGVMQVLFAGYNIMYYGDSRLSAIISPEKPTTPLESIQNQFDPYKHSRGGLELSRAGLVQDWWGRNVEKGDFQHAVFGYGMGATQYSRLGAGELVFKLPYFNASMTGTSTLLWEVGLLGHLLFVVGMLSAARMASRLTGRPEIPVEHQALLKAAMVILVLLAAALPYKGVIFETPPTQFLFMFALGYVAYWWRKTRQGEPRQ